MQSREISTDREKIAKKDVGKMVTNNKQRTKDNEQRAMYIQDKKGWRTQDRPLHHHPHHLHSERNLIEIEEK